MIKITQKIAEHGSVYRVYTEDTDLMGIVYHSNYLRFFERARTELLRYHGLSLTEMSKYDTYFAIKDLHLRFMSPARLDDELSITTSYSSHKYCSLLFEQKMFNQSGQLLSHVTVHVVCVNKALKPKRLPDVLTDIEYSLMESTMIVGG